MLTPQDIETKVFKKSFHGYAVEEVEQFLQEISESYERLYKENLVANDRIAMLSDAVRQYKSMEDTLQNALSVAKQDGEERRQDANTQAEDILKNAQAQASQMLSHSAQEVARVTYQYEQMKRSVEVFRAKVVSLLHAQLDIIKDYSDVLIEEETLKEARNVYETILPKTEEEQKTAEIPGFQDTMEIPPAE